MVLFNIDNYRIEKNPIKSNSNYDTAIHVFKDNEMFCGWHEKSNVSDLDIMEHFMRSVEDAKRRSKATTIEEYFAM